MNTYQPRFLFHGMARTSGFTLAFAASLLLALPCDAQPQRSSVSNLGIAATTAEGLLEPEPDVMVDRRVLELTIGLPHCTALRLDANGLPEVFMDMYFGAKGPANEAELRELAESFHFGPPAEVDPKVRSSDERLDIADERTLFFSPGAIPEGEAKLTYFDQDRDLVVLFRPARLKLSCSESWPIQFHGTRGNGTTSYWYFSGDGVTAVAQARRDRNTNPNLYLQRWTGSTYSTVSSSIQGAWMDYVGEYSPSCSRNSYRVRVYMSNGGDFSLLVITFDASA